MGVDDDVAFRVADAVDEAFEGSKRKGDTQDVKNMFGGVCHLINGNMAMGVMGSGELCLRLDKAKVEAILRDGAANHARPMNFTGKVLTTMVYIDEAGYEKDKDLAKWAGTAVAHALSLPKKGAKGAKGGGGRRAQPKGGVAAKGRSGVGGVGAGRVAKKKR